MNSDLIIDLYNAGAIKFGKFTLKSGKISPYYIQLRELSSYENNVGRLILKKVGAEMGQLILKHVPQVDRLVGVAYAGIPLSIAITMETGIPSCYTRKEIKKHGISRFIEGKINNGDKIVIIDDLITTGESKLEAREAIKMACKLRNIEVQIEGIACIIDREEGGLSYLLNQGLNLYTLIKISDAARILREKSLMLNEEFAEVQNYIESQRSI